jgi:phosphate transport system substrate-binding protein
LIVGRCDIAAASRDTTTNEVELAKARGVEFTDSTIGAYDVAVVVNAGNSIGSLTKEQVRDLFIGTVQNWKDVGGPDAPVHLHIRHPISGTYLGFRELAMENKPYALHLQTYTNYADIVKAVAQDAGGIGYTAIGMASAAGVKPVSIGGMAPSIETVNKGQYPYARTLRFYTDKANVTPITRSFIEFVQSARGQEIVKRMGFSPRP